jgi:hypothetical protein
MAPIESKNLANPRKTLIDFDFIKACDLMFTILNIIHHIQRVVNCSGIWYKNDIDIRCNFERPNNLNFMVLNQIERTLMEDCFLYIYNDLQKFIDKFQLK